MIAFRRITREPQSDVRLHRRIQFRRTAVIYVPAAIFELPAPDIVRQFRDAVRMRLTNYVQVEDVIGFQSGIRFEFPEPVAFRVLERKEVIHAAVDGVVQTPGHARKQTGGRPVTSGFKFYSRPKSHLYVQTPITSLPLPSILRY